MDAGFVNPKWRWEKEAFFRVNLYAASHAGSFGVGRTQKGSDQWSVKMNQSFLFSGEEEREVTRVTF